MSAASSLSEVELKKRRLELLDFLARIKGLPSIRYEDEMIEVMDDGGMGGFRISPAPAERENEVARYVYKDSDGVLVSVVAYADDKHITSVDFWKTDFSQLITFPGPLDLIEEEEIR